MSLPGSPLATLPPIVPTVADLRIGNDERGFAEEGDPGGQEVGGDNLSLGGHRADDDVAAVGLDPLEIADRAEVDQMRGSGQPELHHRDEAVAAGKRAGVLAEIGKQGHGLADGFRAVVGETAWNHGFLPAVRRPDLLPGRSTQPILLMFGSGRSLDQRVAETRQVSQSGKRLHELRLGLHELRQVFLPSPGRLRLPGSGCDGAGRSCDRPDGL